MAGLYLHIPFCAQRCTYCDFYFVTTRSSHTSFVEALCAEMVHYAHTYADREPIETVYVGGGTPSLLHLDDLQRILQTLHDHYDTTAVQEVTLELNPEDADLDYLRGLRTLGIDRLSIGIQSFFEADLEFMNRCHDAEQAAAVVPLAREAGFDAFSVDLIFGVPDQPEEYWAANLEKVIRYEVPHVSTYGLTIEPQTVLHNRVERGLVTPASDAVMTDRYQFTMDYLRSHGYEHYEISSFAQPGYRARHNQLYWQHENYLGFGPSAHSFWWNGLPAHRWSNLRNLKRYEALLRQRQVPLEGKEALSMDALADEYLLLRLRTSDGLDIDHYTAEYGVDLLSEQVDALAWLEAEGYIEPIRNQHVRLTDRGKHVCDTVTSKLLSA